MTCPPRKLGRDVDLREVRPPHLGRPVADGKVGPITRLIWEGYWQAHYDPRLSFPIEYQDAGAKLEPVNS